ncbi:hypothetical protein [Shewanella algae]|uniref:hypothetical protein n=1 Tax=Shewanella algae TaxID=38313 RepID=UPI00313DF6BE
MKKKLQDRDRELSKKLNSTSHIRGTASNRVVGSGNGFTSLNGKKLQTLFKSPVLPAPQNFDILSTKYGSEFVGFLRDFEALLEEKTHIYLSFTETTHARLPMFLLLYAIHDKYKCKISIIWSKESSFVNKVIKKSGAFKSAKERNQAMYDAEQKHIPVISGSNKEFQTFPDALVDAIRDKYYNGDMPPNIEARISQAVIETLENVGRHAYPECPLDEDKKWWLICSLGTNGSQNDKYMYLAIFDAGRGIPLSFGDSKVFQARVKTNYPDEYSKLIHGERVDNSKQGQLIRFVRTAKAMIAPLRKTIGDSGLIYASMMHDITRLDDDSHGQGSESIKDVVTDDPHSKLFIFSNRGCYQYNKIQDNGEEHTRMELENELSGTLLQWSIKLDDLN